MSPGDLAVEITPEGPLGADAREGVGLAMLPQVLLLEEASFFGGHQVRHVLQGADEAQGTA